MRERLNDVDKYYPFWTALYWFRVKFHPDMNENVRIEAALSSS